MTCLRILMVLAVVLGLAGAATPAFAQDSQIAGPARLIPAVLAPPAVPVDVSLSIPTIPDRFATLAAAVAAQDAVETDEALRCLASTIYFEAKGEPIDGQLAVAEVVINRARSGRFPPDVCGVVRQPGQFSFVHGGAIPVVAGGALYRTALAVAKVAMAGAWESSAPRALFFHASRVAGSVRWIRVAAIGNHVFYR